MGIDDLSRCRKFWKVENVEQNQGRNVKTMQGAVLPKAQEMPVPKISTIKNVLSIGIFLAVVCYSAIYANNTFPISEGWNVNYVELI